MAKKTKIIELPTEFNYATQRFEPILPTKKVTTREKARGSWGWIIVLVILLLIFWTILIKQSL